MMGSEGGMGDLGSDDIDTDDTGVDEKSEVSDRGLIPRICSSMFSRMAREGAKQEGTTYRTEVNIIILDASSMTFSFLCTL